MGLMQLYIELAKKTFERQIVYRSAAFAGLMTNIFFGLLRVAIMIALYQDHTEIANLSLYQAITFTGLSQAVIGLLSIFSWYDFMTSVYTGAIATDLLKPMNLYMFWLAQDAGRAFGQLLLRGIPLILAYVVFFDVVLPETVYQWLAVVLALTLAWLLSFSFRFLINLASFWSPNAVGVGRFGFMLIWFFSGFLFPLRYFPEWFVSFCQLTPFPSMVNTFNEIFLGIIDGLDLIRALAIQAFWVLALFMIGQWILRKGIQRLVILGG